MSSSEPATATPIHTQYYITRALPQHLAHWELPPDWRWGTEGLQGEYRHYQEIIDGLGRSLSLVSAANPAHHSWLFAEARELGHRSHPSIPSTFHYWAVSQKERGPGYLRRWVSGETVGTKQAEAGLVELPYVMQIMRGAASSLAYLHDSGAAHGALTPDTMWVTPTGRLWILEWQWAIPRADIPEGIVPHMNPVFAAPEWIEEGWNPTPVSDQWQLAAVCFKLLTGEEAPMEDVPPVKWLRPETPETVAMALDRALLADPEERFSSIGEFIRTADRGYLTKSVYVIPQELQAASLPSLMDDEELALRRAVGDDYEILSRLGGGAFGDVWRARDLSLEREVALKVLHQNIASDGDAVAAFWREARLAAQLAHPAIVPIFDWDGRDGLVWYTMEVAESGSVAQLVSRAGPRSISEIASQVDSLLDGLKAAHVIGVVHRDLKPENILIDRYNRWRITDFGVANAFGEKTQGGVGTLGFAAPEQLLNEGVGPQADYFGLAGIVLFVLTGLPPFVGDDAKVVVANQIAEQLNPEIDLDIIPSGVLEWIQIGLAPAPADRFSDLDAMKRSWRVAARSGMRRERARKWWKGWIPAKK